jgi:thiol:disulfide interchange protein
MTFVRRGRMTVATLAALCVLAPILALAQVAWVKDFHAALKQAAREKKFIVLDISASWCPNCCYRTSQNVLF